MASILIGIEPTAVQNGGSGASPANHATLEQPRLEAQDGADLEHMVTGSQVQALDHPADTEGCMVTCRCPIGMGSSR